jgi:hypothetical protein
MLTPTYDVYVGDALASFQFSEFKRITGAQRILSFGGWDFSTMPETYLIFRNGVKPANRLTMATKIANFIKEHNLDGVDIDWEYPGAPDLPTFDPGKAEDGPNYLAFLVVLKNLLPGKSVAIAAPASYWYLKQFPIAQISRVVNYIVYMTYDLHGQWDAHNAYSQEGCATGNCLRSQVNLTETRAALAMVTKAGVPGEKVVVGVTSYGRSFKMAAAGCWGPNCLFTGDRLNSNAKKGVCTGTAGYIADAEIAEILANPGRVVRSFVDPSSNSDILVYDDTEWVGYMSPATKRARTTLYSSWGMGGTTDWAVDLQQYHDPPAPSTSWNGFKLSILAGDDPKYDRSRSGTWTTHDCTHDMIVAEFDDPPSVRWETLGAEDAWRDVVRIWKDNDKRREIGFIQSVTSTLHIGGDSNCGFLLADSCQAEPCPDGANGNTSGPAAELIWNSMVKLHKFHKDYYDTLVTVATIESFAFDRMERTFAPVEYPDDNKWINLFLNLLTLGLLGAAAPFFNTALRQLAYFSQRTSALDNAKDTSLALIGQSTTIVKDLLPTENTRWSPVEQDIFSHYMGQTVYGWLNLTSLALERLFDGEDDSLKILHDAMSGGKLIDGKFENAPPPEKQWD